MTNNVQSENQPFLDGIRGAAALYVLVAHCTIWGGGNTLPNPKIAVDVFMVLSGYLMMYLAHRRAATEPPGTFTYAIRFWIRRYFRIAPVYYIILAAAFILVNQLAAGFRTLQSQAPERWLNTVYDFNGPHGQEVQFSLANLAAHFSFAFSVIPRFWRSTMLPDWSIGLEMQFYAFFPIILMLGKRFGPLKTLVGLWVCEVVARGLVDHYCGSPALHHGLAFVLMKSLFFLIGMLIANAAFYIRKNPIYASIYLVFGLAISATTSFLVVLVAALIFMLATGVNAQALPLSKPHAAISSLLGNSLTKFMADVSYGVYLVHLSFIGMFGGWLYSQPFTMSWSPVHRLAWLLAVTLIGAYGVSFLLHICIERPGINLGRRILSRLKAKNSQ